MRRLHTPLLLIAVVLFVQTAGPAAGQKPAPSNLAPAHVREQIAAFNTSTTDPVTIIVELAEQPAAVAGRGPDRVLQLNRIRTQRGNVFSQLRRLGIVLSPRHEFELAYNGFSVTLPANQLPLLGFVPEIVGVHPNPEAVREDVTDTLEVAAAPELVNGVPAIGAPAVWDSGFRGEGMLIGIIDDGIDYTHPDLGGCLGPGCKVIGGYDFIELDLDPQQGTTTTGTPPVTTRDSHGTHVSSIAAGLKGVAPAANILGVRVLGSGNRSHLDTIMAGIEFAIANDVDVINMSIGFQNTTAHSGNPYAVMTGNVTLAGIVWANSNGNDGAAGPYRPNMYAASPLVLATGNADARPSAFPRTTVVATGEVLVGGTYGVPFPPALRDVPLPIIDVGFGNTPEAYADKDVAGKVVIASRGGATGEDASFVNKGNRALAAGAAGLIISNNVAGDFSTVPLALPSFTVSQANGLLIRANPLIIVETFSAGPQISAGSSRGPTTDLQIKPDVSAPGTAVVAAVPFEVSTTGYAALSGTSMASPHVAGAALLLRQAHPNWTPAQVKLALMNTARSLTSLTGVQYRTIEQGSGLINVSRALGPALRANPGSISFGQLGPEDEFMGEHAVDVQSGGNYNVAVQWVRNYAGVSAATNMAQIGVGQHTIVLSVGIDPAALPGEYEGYLRFANIGDPADAYHVPFLFAHAIPVSQFQLSKAFARSSNVNPDTVDVSFHVGRPLADWYLGSFPNTSGAHTRFTANQGAAAPGPIALTWNVRTPTNGTLTGLWSVGIHYRLEGSATFQFANAYSRLYIDNVAPLFALDPGLPQFTQASQVTIRGAVGDIGIWSFGEVGGAVLVNGQKADLYPRAPAQIFTANNNEMAFEITIPLVEGPNPVTIFAQDTSGLRSATTLNFTIVRDTVPPVIAFTGARTYTVDETVLVSCTATDPGSGIATTNCGSTPLLEIEAWRLPLGSTTVQAHATDFAGNSATASASVTVVVTYASLKALTLRFFGGNHGSSLVGQLDAAEAAAARGNVVAANSALTSYQQQVIAKTGKSVTQEQVDALVRFAQALKQ